MHQLEKALWYIETRLTDETLTVEAVASAASLSIFRLNRLFAAAIGRPPVQYIRARRLTSAAMALAHDGGKIVDVALAFGFGSHEGFTRAFRAEYGVTPEHVRGRRSVDGLALVHSWLPALPSKVTLAPPKVQTFPGICIAGLKRDYLGHDGDGVRGIPQQWAALGEKWADIPNKSGETGYGVNHAFDSDGGFSYLAGACVTSDRELLPGHTYLRLPSGLCAVYELNGHLSQIPAFMAAIWSDWSGAEPDSSDYTSIELYGERFNPVTGEGVVEVWIPCEKG